MLVLKSLVPPFIACSASSTSTCSQSTIASVSNSVPQNDFLATVSTALSSDYPARDIEYHILVMRSIANNILYDNHCI